MLLISALNLRVFFVLTDMRTVPAMWWSLHPQVFTSAPSVISHLTWFGYCSVGTRARRRVGRAVSQGVRVRTIRPRVLSCWISGTTPSSIIFVGLFLRGRLVNWRRWLMTGRILHRPWIVAILSEHCLIDPVPGQHKLGVLLDMAAI